MGRLIKFEYIGTTFIVQSYMKDDFANICEINGETFALDFVRKTIYFRPTPSLTQNEKGKIANRMNLSELKGIIDDLFK